MEKFGQEFEYLIDEVDERYIERYSNAGTIHVADVAERVAEKDHDDSGEHKEERIVLIRLLGQTDWFRYRVLTEYDPTFSATEIK